MQLGEETLSISNYCETGQRHFRRIMREIECFNFDYLLSSHLSFYSHSSVAEFVEPTPRPLNKFRKRVDFPPANTLYTIFAIEIIYRPVVVYFD